MKKRLLERIEREWLVRICDVAGRMGLKAMDAAGEVGRQYEAKSERGTSQSVPEDRPHATCQMQHPSYSMTLLTVVLHF